MRWERTKCYVICESQADIERDNLRFHIGGAEMQQLKEATYLGMSMTSRCEKEKKNL